MKISSQKTITEKEGYMAMWYMLNNYWELTGSTDLTDILSGGEYIQKDTPADSAFWEYWLEAVKQAKKESSLPFKEFH